MPPKTKPETSGKTRTKTGLRLRDLTCELQTTLGQTAIFGKSTLLTIFTKINKNLPDTLSEGQGKKLETTFLEKVETALFTAIEADSKFETYPGHTENQSAQRFVGELKTDIKAAFQRTRLRTSLTKEEKIEILRGMLTTRYLDARLKRFFMGTEIKTPAGAVFQGKGFRSTGQEAIYAAAIRLRRVGPHYIAQQNGIARSENYKGDFAAVMIRDLGLALAMGNNPYEVLAAQMGKIGHPTNGKDLHFGDLSCGVLPPAAPISLSVGNAVGMGLALKHSGRAIINCNGEGGTSTGEWHEAINFAAVQKLPIVFIVQNNQTALSTPTSEQYACASLAQKANGYGMRAITIDGTDPEAIFAAVTEAADACRLGKGPVMIELVAMRMCGHAHHDDMLYFGQEPQQYLEYADNKENGYVDGEKYTYWRQKDPIAIYSQKLIAAGCLTEKSYKRMLEEVNREIEDMAQQVVAAPWPDGAHGLDAVTTDGPKQRHSEVLANRVEIYPEIADWHSDEPGGFKVNPKGKTFWQAIAEALQEELRRDPEAFILGEDVGGKYGNAFVILKSLLDELGDRLLNTPISESAIIGAATGAALLGKRAIAEIQFNDFVASGFNQLVNNTAKIYARWNQPVPVTIRLPWGGLRNAGPFHSQNTEPWFYRTPGLKIVCPSTPLEAKALLKSAIRDDNPVLFYEHIALYRAPDIKQDLPTATEDFTLPIGKAHIKRDGNDLTMFTYGAYVHRCLDAAEKLQADGISCRVLDLRSLQPLDKEAILWCIKATNRALIVHEDSKTGGIGQSVASIIAEEAFEYLDAPVRVLGALDTPVPYSPTLESHFLVSQAQIEEAARLLAAY